MEVPESLPAGCPIRKSAGRWLFAPYRGLSQLITSFFASESLGILHVPLSPFLGDFLYCRRALRRFAYFKFRFSCHSCSFYSIPAGLRSGGMARFHNVNALFPKWRITDSNR